MTKKKEKTEQELNETTKFFEARKRFSAMPRLTDNIKPSHKAVMARFQHNIGEGEPVNGDTILELLRDMKDWGLDKPCKKLNSPFNGNCEDYLGDNLDDLKTVTEICQDAVAILRYAEGGYIPELEKSQMRDMYLYRIKSIVADMWNTLHCITEDFSIRAHSVSAQLYKSKKEDLCQGVYDLRGEPKIHLTESEIEEMQALVNPRKSVICPYKKC